MKVLFVLSIGLDRPATSGHLLIAMMRALCEAGNTVHILQQDTHGELPAIPAELADCPVTTDVISIGDTSKGNFAARYLAERQYAKNCKKYITDAYDAVFIQSTNNAGATVRAVRKKLPNAAVTINVQDVFPYNAAFVGKIKQNGIVFRMLAKLQRYGYLHADHIITISEDMKDLLVSDGTPEEKIEVVYNWSYQDQPYGELDLSRIANIINRDYFNVVYAGNIGAIQNVELLIEAAKLLEKETDIWFHIIGDGVEKQAVEAKAREYEIERISFWPMQPSELAPYIYSAASVNVIPLKKNTYKTCLPSKTATCLACGRPIIFAFGKESRFAESLAQKTGCASVDSDNPSELADAIRKVHSEGVTSQNTVDFFRSYCSITKNSQKYAEIITAKKVGKGH